MENTKKTQGLIFFSCILLILCFLIFRNIYKRHEVSKSEHYIVAKYIFRYTGKITSYRFAYFVNGKKVESSDTGVSDSMLNSKSKDKKIAHLKLNSFYYAKFDPKYPDVIIVDLNKPISDTLTILKAGFSIEEINRIDE